MWRVTQDPIYRQWEWKIFQALQKYEQLEDGEGYTSLNDVNAILPPRPDNMESLWLVSARSIGNLHSRTTLLLSWIGGKFEVLVFALLTE